MDKLPKLLSASFLALAAVLGAVYTLYAMPARQTPTLTLRLADSATGLSDAEGRPGGQVTMSIVAEGADDMAGVQFKIAFDNSVVTVPQGGVAQGDLPDGFFFQSNADNEEGFVSIVVAGAEAINVESLTIADITFDLRGSVGQTTQITFTEALAGDSSSPPKNIPVSTVNGTITIRTSAAAATPAPTPQPRGGFCSVPTGSASAVDGVWVAVGLVMPAWILLRRRQLL